jgi:L-lactate utilization protein LutC
MIAILTGQNQMHTEQDSHPILVDQFVNSAEKAAATVERIPKSPKSIYDAVLRYIEGKQGAILAEPDDLESELFELIRTDTNIVQNPTDAQLASMAVGITDTFAGIARTGSVCVSNTGNLGGAVSLFTREHLAILYAETIVPAPRDVFLSPAFEGKALERSFVFITGPSATADMGALVWGVHGPDKLHIIILEQSNDQ